MSRSLVTSPPDEWPDSERLPGPTSRRIAQAEATLFRYAVAGSDLLPARLRYGKFRELANARLGRQALPAVRPRARIDVVAPPAVPATSRSAGLVSCVLATGALDSGGVESVVALLAQGLRGHGVAATVLCSSSGRVAKALEESGVDVREAPTLEAAREALDSVGPLVVQLHNAPLHMIEASLRSGAAVVPVIHNMEIHRSVHGWREQKHLAELVAVTVAVSPEVRDHHLTHLGRAPHGGVIVIPNGAPRTVAATGAPAWVEARRAIERAATADLTGAVVLASLARYDAQKNIPGLVAAFLSAASSRPALHLVVAGAPADWLEWRRSDALRRAHRCGDRVHLLGDSDAQTVLAAADVFVLDSFFEGWPMAATEGAVAGLPLVLPEIGGAAHLVGGGARGYLVPNPAVGGVVDAPSIRRARRRSHQRNHGELREAMTAAHDSVTDWRDSRESLRVTAIAEFTAARMVGAHAAVLRAAARRPVEVTGTDAGS